MSKPRLLNKVSIVTGGSKGIGEGVVRVFVREGSIVVFCAISDGRKLEREMNSTGPGKAFFIQCDVSKEQDIKNVVAETVNKYSRIDCLVNNAGTHPPPTKIDEFTGDDFKNLLNTNLVSYFLFSKYTLPYLRMSKGNIINMSSLVGHIGQEGATTYVATKGGISAFTRALAIDEAENDVRVNCVSPGNIWTPLQDSLAHRGNRNDYIRSGADAQLCGRFGTIEEAGETCLYLAADATFTTGVDIILSGGAELNYGKKKRKASDSLEDRQTLTNFKLTNGSTDTEPKEENP